MNQRPGSAKPLQKSTYGAGNPASSLAASQMKKKVEGFDGGVSRTDPYTRMKQSGASTRAGNIGQSFNQNLEQLKSQSSKQVEDEYIKALQEEIKILEYQMKILKDKEIEQQAAVSQIDKFFSDGVPLNDNILALKTQYQNKKTEEQRAIEILRNMIMQGEKEALDLDAEIAHYSRNREGLDREKIKVEEDIQKVIDEYQQLTQFEKRHFERKAYQRQPGEEAARDAGQVQKVHRLEPGRSW